MGFRVGSGSSHNNKNTDKDKERIQLLSVVLLRVLPVLRQLQPRNDRKIAASDVVLRSGVAQPGSCMGVDVNHNSPRATLVQLPAECLCFCA